MPRLMSVALTEDAVRERRKTVTRRLGWWTDRNVPRFAEQNLYAAVVTENVVEATKWVMWPAWWQATAPRSRSWWRCWSS